MTNDVREKSEDDVREKGEDDVREKGEDCVDGTMNPLMRTSTGDPNATPTQATAVKRNEFTTRKTAAHAMMDAALLMANISQLRMLIADDSATTRFFYPLLSLVLFSILCQIIFALLILVIWTRETRKRTLQGPHGPAAEITGHGVGDTPSPNSLIPLHHRHHSSPAWDSFDNGYHHHRNHHNSKPPASGLLNGHMTSIDLDDVNPDARAVVTRQRAGSDGDAAAATASAAKFDVNTQCLHVLTLLLVFLITVTNMFIMGLGFDPAGNHKVGLAADGSPL